MYNIYKYIHDWFGMGYQRYCVWAELFQPTQTLGINSVMTYEQADLQIQCRDSLHT